MKERVKTKVPAIDLKLGMNVIDIDRPWLDTDFLIQGFVIQHREEIDAFIRQCDYVYVEGIVTLKNDYSSNRQNTVNRRENNKNTQNKSTIPTKKQNITGPPSPKDKITYINKIDVEREMPAARSNYASAKSVAKNIMDGIRLGRALDLNQARDTVDNVVDSLLRNDDALVWLTKIKEKDEYTAEHSLNVCILSIAFARFLGHNESDIRKIGLGALLHDVGKSKIPLEVLNKTDRFTEEEFNIMKQHPQLGKNLLSSLPSEDHSAIDIAHSHHERIDGNGYPRNLKSHQIPYFAKVIALTDTYDAITSSRVYDQGRASMEALDIIYKNRNTQFDEELAVAFIKCIGIFPPGAIVVLTNGEVGIVISSNKKRKLQPKIILVKNKNKEWIKQSIIDLSLLHADELNQQYVIAHEVPNGTYDIDIKEFIKKGLVLR